MTQDEVAEAARLYQAVDELTNEMLKLGEQRSRVSVAELHLKSTYRPPDGHYVLSKATPPQVEAIVEVGTDHPAVKEYFSRQTTNMINTLGIYVERLQALGCDIPREMERIAGKDIV